MGISEARLQQEIFTHHWNNYPDERGLLFMVYNNAVNKIQGAQLKSQGMVAGVSDMIYLNPRTSKVQLLELKTKTGTQSPRQKKWQSLVSDNGFQYHLIRSLEEIKKICGWNI